MELTKFAAALVERFPALSPEVIGGGALALTAYSPAGAQVMVTCREGGGLPAPKSWEVCLYPADWNGADSAIIYRKADNTAAEDVPVTQRVAIHNALQVLDNIKASEARGEPSTPTAAPAGPTPCVEGISWRTAFPDFPADGIPPMGPEWIDVSYGNDVCPSFQIPGGFAQVFVDYPNPVDREIQTCARYTVLLANEHGETDHAEAAFACDEWMFVTNFVDEANAAGGGRAGVETAAGIIRGRLLQTRVDDARLAIAENDAAPVPCPDLERAMLDVVALHWANRIGGGWHIDTPAHDYEPAMPAEECAAAVERIYSPLALLCGIADDVEPDVLRAEAHALYAELQRDALRPRYAVEALCIAVEDRFGFDLRDII